MILDEPERFWDAAEAETARVVDARLGRQGIPGARRRPAGGAPDLDRSAAPRSSPTGAGTAGAGGIAAAGAAAGSVAAARTGPRSANRSTSARVI